MTYNEANSALIFFFFSISVDQTVVLDVEGTTRAYPASAAASSSSESFFGSSSSLFVISGPAALMLRFSFTTSHQPAFWKLQASVFSRVSPIHARYQPTTKQQRDKEWHATVPLALYSVTALSRWIICLPLPWQQMSPEFFFSCVWIFRPLYGL